MQVKCYWCCNSIFTFQQLRKTNLAEKRRGKAAQLKWMETGRIRMKYRHFEYSSLAQEYRPIPLKKGNVKWQLCIVANKKFGRKSRTAIRHLIQQIGRKKECLRHKWLLLFLCHFHFRKKHFPNKTTHTCTRAHTSHRHTQPHYITLHHTTPIHCKWCVSKIQI